MRQPLTTLVTHTALVGVLTALAAPSLSARPQSPAPAPVIEASAIPGQWAFTVDSPHGKLTFAMELRLESGKVTGSMSQEQMGTIALTGAFAEQTVKLSGESPGGAFTFTGKFKDRDTIAGFMSGHAGDMVGVATRVKS